MSSAAALAAATPVTRDRFVDLVRVLSLGTVIVGHWLMAVVGLGPGGALSVGNVLAVVPALQPLTWLFQVMPLFFFVGGFAHAAALRRGAGYADFARSRAERLLRPTLVFVAVWLVFALGVELTGNDRGVLRLATRVVAQPLWFVGVYLGVVALAPVMLRLHRRHGPVVIAWLVAGVALVDVLRFAAGVPYVAFANFVFVWLAVHQLGFAYADGSLTRHAVRLPAALAGVGFAGLMTLTAFGPYPISMVGMPGEKVSNMAPPTLALLAHALWLVGVVLLLREPPRRWLARPRVWTGVVAASGVAMTAFLWHLTALFVVTAFGVPQPDAGTAAWWAQRPLVLGACAAVTAVLIAVFRGAERPRPVAVGGEDRVAAVGLTLCVIGVLGFASVGFGGLLAGRSATLVAVPVTPLWSLVLLMAGYVLVRLRLCQG